MKWNERFQNLSVDSKWCLIVELYSIGWLYASQLSGNWWLAILLSTYGASIKWNPFKKLKQRWGLFLLRSWIGLERMIKVRFVGLICDKFWRCCLGTKDRNSLFSKKIQANLVLSRIKHENSIWEKKKNVIRTNMKLKKYSNAIWIEHIAMEKNHLIYLRNKENMSNTKKCKYSG